MSDRYIDCSHPDCDWQWALVLGTPKPGQAAAELADHISADHDADGQPNPAPDPIAELREGLLEIAVKGPVRARGAAVEVAAPWMVAAQSAYAAAQLLELLVGVIPVTASLLACSLNDPSAVDHVDRAAVDAARHGLPVAEWIADARAAAEVTR